MKKIVPFLFVFPVLLLWFGCPSRDPAVLYSWQGETMGTTYEVKFYSGKLEDAELEGLQERVEQELKEVNNAMSTWLEDSEISRFNRLGAMETMEIGSRFQTVVKRSIDIYKQTDFAFDPTLGPLINLWGFGAEKPTDSHPSSGEISDALSRIGMSKVVLEGNTLSKTTDGLELNLSAIAKGYGVDRIAAILDDAEISAFYVEVGGEVLCHGLKPDGNTWNIGIQIPDPEADVEAFRIVQLRTKSLATSGDYRNFSQSEEGRVHHIIDPRTGKPAEHLLASVSVMASDCMTADAVATALYVMGTEEGMTWLSQQTPLEALFIDRTETGFKLTMTQGFRERLIDTESK